MSKMKLSIDKNIQEIPFYPMAMKYGLDDEWARLASNENPFPPSQKVLSSMRDALSSINRYPGNGFELKTTISDKYNVKPEQVVLGDGSDELIELALKAMKHQVKNKVIISEPSFAFYSIASKIYGYETCKVPVTDMKVNLDHIKEAIDDRTRVIFLNNPLNPTGTIFEDDAFKAFLQVLPPDILVVADEAYAEFSESRTFPDTFQYINDYPVLILRTFSKAYALAGLRIGYGIGEASLMSFIERTRQPFSVNTIALTGAKAAMEDAAYFEKVLKNNRKGKKFFYNAFNELSIEYVLTESNFILFKYMEGAEELMKRLFEDKILVRWMSPYGLPDYIRVSIGKMEENKRFIETLRKIL
jgi:histidinol-phosphate aminotransferase